MIGDEPRISPADFEWNCLHYLDPVITLGGVLPLNLGWMHKLAADGNFRRGKAIVT